ncbi:MAG: hypothetical protein GY757_26490, partial [bacterium]|nr:hypothetical protein [bacterium]
MNILKNTKFRNKLILVLLLPMAGMLYFSISGIFDKFRISREMTKLQDIATLAVDISKLVHEIQKERGATAGFMGSKGNKFQKELAAQRLESDKRINELKDYLKDFNQEQYSNQFQGNLSRAMTGLGQIGTKRKEAGAFQISSTDAIGYYTGLNASFLHLISDMIKLSPDARVSTMAAVYVNFLQGKERAGIERAVMSSTFARDNFAPGMFRRFSSLVTQQQTFMSIFLERADELQKQFYNEKMSHKAVGEVVRMRKIAFDKAAKGNFNVNAGYWFNTITAKINLLKEVENKLSEDLITVAGGLKKSAIQAFVFNLIVTSFLILVTILFGYIVTVGILKQLGGEVSVISRLAQKISDGEYSAQIEVKEEDSLA